MYKRQVLVDQSPMSIKQTNDNFAALFYKISGNINGFDMRDGTITGQQVAAKTITGDHILDGSLTILNLEDGFVGNLDFLENAAFTSLANDVAGNSTLIQQNSNQITLQASKVQGNTNAIARLDVKADEISATVGQQTQTINGMQTDISNLSVRSDEINAMVQKQGAVITTVQQDFLGFETVIDSHINQLSELNIRSDNIELQVSQQKTDVDKLTNEIVGLQYDMASLDVYADEINSSVRSIKSDMVFVEDSVSEISQKADEINIEVKQKIGIHELDMYGPEIVSSINMTPSRIKIEAKNIDLTGVTTIYDEQDKDTYIRMGGNLWSGTGDAIMSVVKSNQLIFQIDDMWGYTTFSSRGIRLFETSFRDGKRIEFPSICKFRENTSFDGNTYFSGDLNWSGWKEGNFTRGLVSAERGMNISLMVDGTHLYIYSLGSQIGKIKMS